MGTGATFGTVHWAGPKPMWPYLSGPGSEDTHWLLSYAGLYHWLIDMWLGKSLILYRDTYSNNRRNFTSCIHF